MKITAITIQTRDKNRVNVSVDGKYRFSLDIFQVGDIGLKVGREYDEAELLAFESESQFGKLYGRSLEYCLIRPRSAREVRDYLYRKTKPIRGKTGELRPGIPPAITTRVLERLTDKGYIDDQKFAHFWAENRSLVKGVSRRKLVAELLSKGIDNTIIEQALTETGRDDALEIQKIITKKRARYPEEQKLMMYLARLGFGYDDIKKALSKTE